MHALSSVPSVKCSLWNSRSANGKLSEIAQLISDKNMDMLVLTETWQAKPSESGKLDTFAASFRDYAEAENLDVALLTEARRDGRIGGGVALVAKKLLPISRYSIDLPVLQTSFEYLAVKCKFAQPFILVCIYRPSSSSFSDFQTEFANLLSSLSLIALPSIVAGDFNVQLNTPNEPCTASFLTILEEFNFSIIPIDSPTHNCGNTLDFAIVMNSFLYKCSSCEVDDSFSLSDHFPVTFCIDQDVSSNHRSSRLRYQTLSTLDDSTFPSVLQEALSELPTDVTDLSFSSYLSRFRNALATTLHDNCIEKHFSESNAPWMDQEYISARSLRKRLQNLPNKSRYNAQNRLCARMAERKRTEYYSNLVITSCNQKETYKTLHKITHNKRDCINPFSTSPQETANSLNAFFVQKVVNIRNSLPPSSFEMPIPETNIRHSNLNSVSELSSFSPTSCEELQQIVDKHGIKLGPGDPLPLYLMKKHINVLLPYLAILVNISLSTASCEGIKESHVTPILKSLSLDYEEFQNLRPVSILSFVSKLTERVVDSRINAHLAENSLHNSSQFGYKKHHSCETMLLKLVDDILVGVDKKFGVVVLMVDLSAAFDTVDHSLLLNILEFKFHITGLALSWLRSFLTGRFQRVKIDGFLSNALLVSYGVPQGSILGPLLFNLYCSSIDEAFANAGFSCMGYADDNLGHRLFPAFLAPSTLLFSVSNCLRAIHEWADAHFLKLNPSKTKVMVFGDVTFRSSFNYHSFRNEYGDICCISDLVTLLGVDLDSELTFDKYVSNTVSSINFSLRNIRLIRKLLNREATEMLVHSVITNKLDMCNSLLMGTSVGNIAKLQRCQNLALRVVLNLPARSPISDHLKEQHWLNVEIRIHFKYLVLVFKCVNSLAPDLLASKLSIKHPMDMLLDIDFFKPCTSSGRKAFSYLGPRCWNALPRYLRIIGYLETFKAKLKHYLFENFQTYKHCIFPYSSFAISQGVITPYFNNRSSVLQDTEELI